MCSDTETGLTEAGGPCSAVGDTEVVGGTTTPTGIEVIPSGEALSIGARGECVDDADLCLSDFGDPRQWVRLKRDGWRTVWPRNWPWPTTLIHYPPRSGRWFWERWQGVAGYCPVGSVAILPEPLSDEEVDAMVRDHAERHRALLCMADRSYLRLYIGTVRAEGDLDVRGEIIVPAWRSEWENQVTPQVLAHIDETVDAILADPDWATEMRRRAPVELSPAEETRRAVRHPIFPSLDDDVSEWEMPPGR
jgi:hypothetical protein